MTKNKSYYMDLADRRFEGLLTEDEELELKSFLASTEDPDFDEVKAVAGYFAMGKALSKGRPAATARPLARGASFRWAAAFAAACLVLVAAIGLYHRQNNCYILAYGEKSTDVQLVFEDMSATLEGIFGESEDVGEELFDLFNPAL